MEPKRTLVLGASDKPSRYANIAIHRLRAAQHEVHAIGARQFQVADVEVVDELKQWNDPIDTVTIYLRPELQVAYYDYILALKPKRIIFNPGTENSELQKMANEDNIATENACTLVLLSISAY